MTVYFTSDTHFGDPRVLRIDKRPFGSIPEHDAGLIERWNAVVGPEDEVWHLGDFALHARPERIDELLDTLHGRKHLIVGNNDGEATLAAAGWDSVQTYAEIKVDGTPLVLCHYAFRTWKNMGKGWLDLHGHSHGASEAPDPAIRCRVDVWGYQPVTLEAIRTGAGRIESARHKQD
jgi:calcineurin-like phosphoesterase family protein